MATTDAEPHQRKTMQAAQADQATFWLLSATLTTTFAFVASCSSCSNCDGKKTVRQFGQHDNTRVFTVATRRRQMEQ
jgi:hypothetical protein